VAIFTLAAEAGPRLTEISALKVRNVANGLVRFEDGHTKRGGHAGNKGRRVPSDPDAAAKLSGLARRGDDRNRTGVDGFAGRCVATPPRRRGSVG
jgi:integrase